MSSRALLLFASSPLLPSFEGYGDVMSEEVTSLSSPSTWGVAVSVDFNVSDFVDFFFENNFISLLYLCRFYIVKS